MTWGQAIVRALTAVAAIFCVALINLAAADEPSPPDPLRFTQESTKYFDAKGDVLDQRILVLRKQLDELRTQIAPDQQAFLAPLIDEIGFTLNHYRQVVAQPMPVPPPEKPFTDRYDLRQLAQVIEQADAAGRMAASLRREVERRQSALGDARQHYDTLVVAYSRLSEEDPERLRTGLELIRDWLAISANRIDLDRRAAAAAIAQTVSARLEQEIRVAGERLSVGSDDIAAFVQGAAAAQQNLDTLARAADTLRKQMPPDSATADQVASKKYEHDLLQSDIKIALGRLELSEQNLLVALSRVLADDREGTTTGAEVAARLNEKQRLHAEITSALADWRWTVDQDIVLLSEGLNTAEASDDEAAGTWRASLDEARQSADAVARLIAETERGKPVNDLAATVVAKGQGFLATWWLKANAAIAGTIANADQWATTSLFRLGDTPITLLGIIQVAATVAVAWWLSRLSTKGLGRLAARDRINQAVLYTISRLVRYGILTLGVIIGLSLIGFDFTHLAIVTGALGVGIGFGLQTIFNNFVSGLILLFARSIKVGDYIELHSGTSGEVREIDIRSTRIRGPDGVDIVVPNSEFVENSVKNWTLSDQFRRLHVPFGVAYGTDKALVKKAALDAADQVQFTHRSDPGRQPQLWMTSYGDSSVNFELVVWLIPAMVSQAATALSAYLWAIDDALAKYAIELPFPQRDLRLRTAVPIKVVREREPGLPPAVFPGSGDAR